jgi:hypothetical protein
MQMGKPGRTFAALHENITEKETGMAVRNK